MEHLEKLYQLQMRKKYSNNWSYIIDFPTKGMSDSTYMIGYYLYICVYAVFAIFMNNSTFTFIVVDGIMDG